MSLDNLIPPEIVNDIFYRTIASIASTQPLKHILEIGSSSGEGSTKAWVEGIKHNPSKPTLHCIELSRARFQALSQYYVNNSQVKCYWASSVGVEFFATESELIEFYNNTASKLRQWPLETVLNWLQTDLDYIQTHNAPSNGIMQALRSTKQNAFDAVLIDGSEFTGTAEFAQTYGATWILLDDILTFKNWNAFNFLINDSRYQLILRQVSVRNGFAVFQRKQQ